METVRILLADDHTLFRQSLKFMLDRQERLTVVGEASDGLEAVTLANQLKPDVILMDVCMPGGGGLAALRQILRDLPDAKVIMLTVSEDDEDLFAAVQSGAKGYLLKTADASDLVKAVGAVIRGGAVVSPPMEAKLLNQFAAAAIGNVDEVDAAGSGLTAREKEILELLGQGLGNSEIAAKLCVAKNTVKRHVQNIMDKLHMHNRAQAAAYAVRSQVSAQRRGRRLR